MVERTRISRTLLILCTISSTILYTSAGFNTSEKSQKDSGSAEPAKLSTSAAIRDRREVGHSTDGLLGAADSYEEREKKVPREFRGLRGKKGPSGFLGMRGRRSGNEEPFEGEHSYRDHQALPVSEEDLSIRLGADPQDDGKNVIPSLELIKRAPSGFLGMRGKKVPSGFVGMRGKKAPFGFLGMRGKKDDASYDDLESVLQALSHRYQNNQEKRAPRGFLGMRGKKFHPDYYADAPDYSTNEEPTFNDVTFYNGPGQGYDKRAPSGFLGMRG